MRSRSYNCTHLSSDYLYLRSHALIKTQISKKKKLFIERNIYYFTTTRLFDQLMIYSREEVSLDWVFIKIAYIQVFGSKEQPSSPEIRFSSVTQRDTEDKVHKVTSI